MASLGSAYTNSEQRNAWYGWVTTSTTSNTTAANLAWNTWCDTGTSATTCATNYNASAANVYTIWVSADPYNQNARYHGMVQQVQAIRERTAEEIAAAKKATEEADKRYKAERERKAAASKRALELLREHLTAKQREDLENRKFFLVQGGKTGKSYRIRDNGSASGNIDEMADNDNEKVAARLCAHAPYASGIPNADQLLAQMLMLRFEEEDMLRIANRTPMAA